MTRQRKRLVKTSGNKKSVKKRLLVDEKSLLFIKLVDKIRRSDVKKESDIAFDGRKDKANILQVQDTWIKF